MALSDTYGNYQKEMEQTCRNCQKIVKGMQKNLPKLMKETQPRVKEMMKAISDTSRVSIPQKLVIEVFAWSAIVVFATSVGSIIGAYVLNAIFSLVLAKFVAVLLAYFIVPFSVHATIRQKENRFESDNNIRRMILLMSFGQGLFAGFTISEIYLSAQPVAFLTPVAVSVGYSAVVQRARGDRVVIVGSALGSALALNVLIGLITGQFTVSYQFLALGYVAISGVVMQLLIHNAHFTRGHVYVNVLNAMFVLFKGMTFYLFGSSNEK